MTTSVIWDAATSLKFRRSINVESVRDYCLSLPLATEDFPFDETTLAFRVLGKIFAMIDLDYAVKLRDKHFEIKGSWHMNKKLWNQIRLSGGLPDSLIQELIHHSYAKIVKKMPNKLKHNHAEVLVVQ